MHLMDKWSTALQISERKLEDRINIRRYTGKQEMIDYIRNTIDAFAYHGFDIISDQLEDYIYQITRSSSHCKFEVIFFLCLLQQGVGNIQEKVFNTVVDKESFLIDFEYSDYSSHSEDSAVEMENIMLDSSVEYNIYQINNELKYRNSKQIVQTFQSYAFWKSETCNEFNYIKHVLFCLITNTDIGGINFSNSKIVTLFFQDIIDYSKNLEEMIEKPSPFLFMRNILKKIDNEIQKMKILAVECFHKCSEYWKCDGKLMDLPFNSVIEIRFKFNHFHYIFKKLQFLTANPFSVPFKLYQIRRESQLFQDLYDVATLSNSNFAIDFAFHSKDLTKLGNLRNLRNFDIIESLHQQQNVLREIGEIRLKSCLHTSMSLRAQFEAINSEIGAFISKKKESERVTKLLEENSIRQSSYSNEIEHLIIVLTHHYIWTIFKKSVRNQKYLLESTSYGTVSPSINLDRIEYYFIDNTYKVPLILIGTEDAKLRVDTKDCKLSSENIWLSNILETKICIQLVILLKRVIYYSNIPVKKYYCAFLSQLLFDFKEVLQLQLSFLDAKPVDNIRKIVEDIFDKSASPSDVQRIYTKFEQICNLKFSCTL
eukprot:NODE_193_length_13314_cov_0.305638.p3 type:complete len:597 gc:universal NODE_193_length_13314_cov_0.305638:10167-11957(+)